MMKAILLVLAAVLAGDASAQTGPTMAQFTALQSYVGQLATARNRDVARIVALEGKVTQVENRNAILTAEIARAETIMREHRTTINRLSDGASNLSTCWNGLISAMAAGATLSPAKVSNPVITYDPVPSNWKDCRDRTKPAPQWPSVLADLPAP